MQLTQSITMRQDMRQLLTPRMIQSMEILQLPLALLEERIEQELQQNPVLELKEPEGEAIGVDDPVEPDGDQALIVDEDNQKDFERLERISEYLENEEFSTNAGPNFRAAQYDGERDRKMDAMANTPERSQTLQDHLARRRV